MANLFLVPHNIISGEDALKMGADLLASVGKKALIVTDKAMVDLGNVKKLTDELDARSISYYVYADINTEPVNSMIDVGVDLFKKGVIVVV